MYKALYRKYRPTVFSDVEGQRHITDILEHQIMNGSFSHAYLFTGSRGTGKTTCAKIFAKAVNCLSPENGNPCCKCENCLAIGNESLPDVMEIDAASNNGVENIRELRDRIAFSPVQGKYKVYIIDEFHMLSSSASNALLKTLEEPPAHAIFILATTEVNAILPTILSRCQRYDFHRIEPETIAKRLTKVAELENISLDNSSAMLIASLADGGMRDALSIMDLAAAADTNITEDLINKICGRAALEYLFSIAEGVSKGDTVGILRTVAELHAQSIDMKRLGLELCEFYRTVTLICSGMDAKAVSGSTSSLAQKYEEFAKTTSAESAIHCFTLLNNALSEMETGNRRAALESALIKLANPRLSTGNEALLSRISALEAAIKRCVSTRAPIESSKPQKAEAESPKGESQSSPAPTVSAEEPPPPPIAREDDYPTDALIPIAEWNDVINACFKFAPVLYSVIFNSTASRTASRVVIHSPSDRLRGMLADKSGINYRGLCSAIAEVMGEELIPILEKPQEKTDNDPLAQFAQRLENL